MAKVQLFANWTWKVGLDVRKLGLAPSALNYDFFAGRYSETCLAEIYTEYFILQSETCLPVTLNAVGIGGHYGKKC